MDKIFSPIKERIFLYIENKGVKREVFFAETNISASNFKGKGAQSELGGDKIAKILTTYKDLNAEWLLRGEGEMLKIDPSTDNGNIVGGIGNVSGSGNVIGNRVANGNINGNGNNVGIIPSDCEKALVRAKTEIEILKKKIKENEILNKKRLDEVFEQCRREKEILNKMLEQAILDKDKAMSMLEKALSR